MRSSVCEPIRVMSQGQRVVIHSEEMETNGLKAVFHKVRSCYGSKTCPQVVIGLKLSSKKEKEMC